MEMASENDYLKLRKGISRYVELAEEEWEAFKSIVSFHRFAKGEFLVKADDVCTVAAFICQGVMRYYYLKDGNEYIGHIAMEGEFISAYSSFLTERPTRQLVDTLEPTNFFSFSRKDLFSLYDKYKNIERLGRKIAEEIIVGSQYRTAMMLFNSAEERYDWLVSARKELLNRIPQYMLASYIGIKPESLSRLRKKRVSSS